MWVVRATKQCLTYLHFSCTHSPPLIGLDDVKHVFALYKLYIVLVPAGEKKKVNWNWEHSQIYRRIYRGGNPFPVFENLI